MPQSLARILIHVVFSTKNREPWIDEKIEPEVHAYLGGVLRELQSPAIIVGGTSDHVHLLCSLSKTLALSELIEKIKHSSSLWIKTKGTEYQNAYWQGGYAAFSIGESGVDALTKYIQKQREHHKKRSFQDELRELFRKYHVEFDERFVWK